MAMKTMLMLLFIAIATSNAQLQILRINGTLYCSTNGSPAGNGIITPVFPGATMSISCTGNILAVVPPLNATTDSNGYYIVNDLPRANGTVAAIVSNCRLFVHTPLSACNPTLPSASLVSNLQFVKTVDVLFARTIYMVASGFTLQP